MRDKLLTIYEETEKKSPLIHCITGGVSANFCANGILSVGGRPVCAHHPREVAEISASADALFVGLSGITRDKQRAICIALAVAGKKKIPAIFDAVGVACSSYRRRLAKKLIKRYKPTVIKGNYSEIYALYNDKITASGVDNSG